MLYALFCYADEAALAQLPRETMNALVESHVRYDYELIRTEEPGRVLAERWLKPSATGVTVRPGPAGEIRPVAVVEPAEPSSNALTMFYLLNCESEDEAVRLAGRYPWLDYGHVEVRPVMGEWDYAPSIDTAATAGPGLECLRGRRLLESSGIRGRPTYGSPVGWSRAPAAR